MFIAETNPQESAMTTITFRRTESKIDFKRVLRQLGARLRRAFELSAAPYMNGAMPSM
jgi:hypothetical protein